MQKEIDDLFEWFCDNLYSETNRRYLDETTEKITQFNDYINGLSDAELAKMLGCKKNKVGQYRQYISKGIEEYYLSIQRKEKKNG